MLEAFITITYEQESDDCALFGNFCCGDGPEGCDPCVNVEGDFNPDLEIPGEDGEEGQSCAELGEVLPLLPPDSFECLTFQSLSFLCCGEGLAGVPCFEEGLEIETCTDANMCECDDDDGPDTATEVPTIPGTGFPSFGGPFELDICAQLPEDPSAELNAFTECCPECTDEAIAYGTCLVNECSLDPIVVDPGDAPAVAPVVAPVVAPAAPILDQVEDEIEDEIASGGAGPKAALVVLAAMVGYAML